MEVPHKPRPTCDDPQLLPAMDSVVKLVQIATKLTFVRNCPGIEEYLRCNALKQVVDREENEGKD